MVHRTQRRPTLLIRDCYFGVLDAVMREHNIRLSEPRPDPTVTATATLADVVRYTDWYYRGGDSQPHYRYHRYRGVLDTMQPAGKREAHVDIGCGAGLFSWAFLDWAREKGLDYDRIDLYGLDHSQAMINLAGRMRVGLLPDVPDYPELRYTNSVAAILRDLRTRHRAGTDYTVTFGHILVQAPGAIPNFARIIAYILRLQDAQSSCALMAVDARGASLLLAQSWSALLNSLTKLGIQHKQAAVPASEINSNNDAKIAWLSRSRQLGG